MSNKKETSDIEALIFRPSKVSWGVQNAIIKLNPKIERVTLISVISIVLLAVLWAHFSIKAVVVDTSGEITPVASPIPVIALGQMTIKEIKVRDNQQLNKDDIVILSTRYLEKDRILKIEKVFSDLKKLVMNEKSSGCSELCFAELGFLTEDGFSFIQDVQQASEFHRELVDLSKHSKDYYLQLKTIRTLPETLRGLRNELRITERRISQIELRKAQNILAIEYEELQNKQISLTAQLKEKELSSKAMIDNVRSNIEIAVDKIGQSFKVYQQNSYVKAPTTGRIRFSGLKGVGQTVAGGEVLFMITQSSSDLWLKFILAEADLGKVKNKQEVKMDLASYPASEYGVQKGVIVEVLDKLPAENDPSKSPSFIGYARLNSQRVKSRGAEFNLRSGMQAKVKIIVKHESLLTIFIKKVFSIKDEYLGDI
jgi:hypothetical protein